MPSSNSPSDDDNVYEVEDVMGRKTNSSGDILYQIKWKGYEERTWQLAADCNCPALIAEFNRTHPSPEKGSPDRPTRRSSHSDLANSSSNSRAQDSSKRKRSLRNAKEDTPASVDSLALPSSSRGRPSSSTPTGRQPPNQRSSRTRASTSFSRAARSRSTSSEESRRSSKRNPQSRAGASAKRAAVSSSESEEDEQKTAPASSRMNGRPPSSMSKGGTSSKNQTAKRMRKSSDKGSGDSGSGSGSESSEYEAGDKERKGSLRRSTIRRRSVNLPMDEETPPPSTSRRSRRAKESSDDDDEMVVRRTPRRNQSGRQAVVDNSDSEKEEKEEEEEEEEEDPGSSGRRRKSTNGGSRAPPPSDLDTILTDLLAVDPYVVPVGFPADGKKPKPMGPPSKYEVIVPVKIFNPMELHNLDVWTEEAYAEEYPMDTADYKKDQEVFCGREVERVVGYALHATHPFVLVKLALKNNETSVPVREAVQAAHCGLAARIFPKAFAAYMNRVALVASSEGGLARQKGSHPTPTSNGRGIGKCRRGNGR